MPHGVELLKVIWVPGAGPTRELVPALLFSEVVPCVSNLLSVSANIPRGEKVTVPFSTLSNP